MRNKICFSLLMLGAGAGFVPASANAYDFKSESGAVDGSFVSTIGIGFGRRTGNPSCDLVGDSGACGGTSNPAQWSPGDDGNLNYKKGDFFTAYLKGTHELLLKVPDQDLKFMIRGTWKKDFKADDTHRTDLSDSAKDQIVNNAELLDFWVSKEFTAGGQNGRVKLGNQVISWGEASFFVGGVSNNVLDSQKLAVPGTQMKEAFLPIPALSVASTLGDGFSAEGYYQFKWRRTRVAPVGSYFSATDIYNKGRVPAAGSMTNFNASGPDQYVQSGQRKLSDAAALGILDNLVTTYGLPIHDDIEPRNSGQWGLSVRWTPEGSSVNLGAYAMNYHDQFPVLRTTPDANAAFATAYQWQFLEDRKMYGVSANFPVGNWAIGTELSYRPKDAMALGGCFNSGGALDANTNGAVLTNGCPYYKDNKKYQASVTAMLQLMQSEHGWLLGALGGANSGFITAEAAYTRYPGANNRQTRMIDGVAVDQVAAAGYFTAFDSAGNAARIGSEGSWGYVVDMNWTYDGKLIPGWQVTPGVTFVHAVNGDTPNYAAQFLEGNKSANFYVLFNQNPVRWQAGINYTAYFGGKNDVVERQYFKDRDFLGAFVNYTF